MKRFAALVSLSLVAACQVPSSSGSSDGGVDGGTDFAVHLCARLDACMIAMASCVPTYRAIVYGASCQSALLSASCSDLSSPSTTGPLAACFPACGAPGSATCSGSTYTECTTSGVAQTWHCEGRCALSGTTFTGTCGDAFEGQTSAAPMCWCK